MLQSAASNTVDSAKNDFVYNAQPATTSKNSVTRKVIKCCRQTMLIVKNTVYRPIALFHSIMVSVTQCQGHMKVRWQKFSFIFVVFSVSVLQGWSFSIEGSFYGQCFFHARIRKVMFSVPTMNSVQTTCQICFPLYLPASYRYKLTSWCCWILILLASGLTDEIACIKFLFMKVNHFSDRPWWC